MASVFIIAGAEFLPKELFLTPRFEVKGHPENCKGQPRSGMSFNQDCSQSREENPGVNRMADPLLESGADELMPLFQCDHAAPVRAEADACPNADSETYCREGQSNPPDRRR